MTDHQINKILAAVAGVDVWNHHDIRTSLDVWTDGYRLWTPLTDHNQMALVKAGLREQNVGHAIVDRGSGCKGAIGQRQDAAIIDSRGIAHVHGLIDAKLRNTAEQPTGTDGQIVTGQVEGTLVEDKAAVIDQGTCGEGAAVQGQGTGPVKRCGAADPQRLH